LLFRLVSALAGWQYSIKCYPFSLPFAVQAFGHDGHVAPFPIRQPDLSANTRFGQLLVDFPDPLA
jgi:hypothetical protein